MDILQNKNIFIIMQESTYQKDMSFINVYEVKYMKLKLRKLRG